MQPRSLARISPAACILMFSSAASAQQIHSSDHYAAHVSTLAANPGQKVALHVHRKIASQQFVSGRRETDRVVLFVHGATTPGTAAFGFDHNDYDWMAFLARAGFDVWAMDMSGYGSSPAAPDGRPLQVDPKQQELLLKRLLTAPCAPHYALKFKTIRDDWAEIDSVIDHIRSVTGAPKVSVVGWSAGGPRVGGYVSLHPDKINRVVLYAPGAPRAGFKPAERPEAGFPVTLQTRTRFERERWDPDVRCSGQVEPGVRDALWTQIMQWDPIGAGWGPEEGVTRAPTTMNGWSTEQANSLKMPVMVVVGEFDVPDQRRAAYDAVGNAEKVFVKVACASHFMLWEKQHNVLHHASLEWLRDGKFAGASQGAFGVDEQGKSRKAE